MALETIGTVSAVVSLLGELEACGSNLRRFIRNVRYAKRDIERIKTEVDVCIGLCTVFTSTVQPIKGQAMERAQKKDFDNLERLIQGQTKIAHGQILDLLDHLTPLHKRVRSSVIEQTWAKLRWNFSKDDLELPMATLGSVKGSLSLLSVIILLNDKTSKASQSKISAKEKEILMQEIKTLKGIIRRTEAEWKKARENIQRLDHDHHDICMANLEKIKDVMQPLKNESVFQARKVTRDLALSSPSTSISTRTRGISTFSRSQGQTSDTLDSIISPFSSISGSRSRASSARHFNSSRDSRNNPRTPTDNSRAIVVWREPDNHENNPETTEDFISDHEEVTEEVVYHDYDGSHRETYTRHVRPGTSNSIAESLGDPSSQNHSSPSQMYVPIPPFNTEDYREFRRHSRTRRRRRDSRVD